jgi:hypothetical protein
VQLPALSALASVAHDHRAGYVRYFDTYEYRLEGFACILLISNLAIVGVSRDGDVEGDQLSNGQLLHGKGTFLTAPTEVLSPELPA